MTTIQELSTLATVGGALDSDELLLLTGSGTSNKMISASDFRYPQVAAIQRNQAALVQEIANRIAADQSYASQLTTLTSLIASLTLAEEPGAAELISLRDLRRLITAATAYAALDDALSGVYNAASLGMKPSNGAADNGAAWRTIVESGAGTIIVPEGTYGIEAIGSHITMTGGNVRLYGYGATLQLSSASDKFLLWLLGTNRVLIEGFTFDCNGRSAAIQTNGAFNTWIRHCEFKNAPSDVSALSVTGNTPGGEAKSTDTYIELCYLHDCESRAMTVTDARRTFIQRSVFDSNGGSASPYTGLNVESHAKQGGDPGDDESVIDLFVTHNYFLNSTGPGMVVTKGTSSILPSRIHILHNVAVDSGSSSYNLGAINDLTVLGNWAINSGATNALGIGDSGTQGTDLVCVYNRVLNNLGTNNALGLISITNYENIAVAHNIADGGVGFGFSIDSCSGDQNVFDNLARNVREGFRFRDTADLLLASRNRAKNCTGPGFNIFSGINFVLDSNIADNTNTAGEESAEFYWKANSGVGRLANNIGWNTPTGSTYTARVESGGSNVLVTNNDFYGGSFSIHGAGGSNGGGNRT